MKELGEAERSVAELQGAPRGTVRITAPANLDRAWIASVLVAFRADRVLITVGREGFARVWRAAK